MKTGFQKTALGVFAMLACFSLPAYSYTVISLNIGTAASGTWSDTSGVFSGTFNFNQVIVSDPSESYTNTYSIGLAADDFSISFCSGTASPNCTGGPSFSIKTGSGVESPFTNLATSTAFYTGMSGLSFNSSGSTSTQLSETFSATISGVSTSFLADLHLPTSITTLTISGGTISGPNGHIVSDNISLFDTADVIAAPEPSSIFLLMAGFAVGAIAWKRRRATTQAARA
jgi:hypothetical protein